MFLDVQKTVTNTNIYYLKIARLLLLTMISMKIPVEKFGDSKLRIWFKIKNILNI